MCEVYVWLQQDGATTAHTHRLCDCLAATLDWTLDLLEGGSIVATIVAWFSTL